MTDDNENAELSPEFAAELRRRAVVEYMGTSPEVDIGDISEENLLRWQEALDTPNATPTETWAAGWTDFELAMHYSFNESSGEDDAESLAAAIDRLLLRAQEKFLRIKEHESMQVHSLWRSQATLAAASTAVWSDVINGRSAGASTQKYNAEQAVAAGQLMKYYAENPSVEAAMWADTLTFISVVSTKDDMIALVCPPRLTSPYIDSHHRQSAMLFDTGTLYKIRVGSKGTTAAVHIPYELLGHERYSSQKLGTVLAMMHIEEAILHGRSGRVAQFTALEQRTTKAQRHLDAVYDDIAERIASEQTREQQWHDVPNDPREWVTALLPGRNPYVVDAERTDAAISPLELQVLDETITAQDAVELGWLYTEVAFGRAINPTVPVAQIRGDIDRAEEIFSLALEKTDEQNVLQFCEASLAHGVAWMQRLVLCNDELRTEDIDFYRQVLVYTGRRASARYMELRPTDPEAVELEKLMRVTTLCLLTMTEGDGIITLVTPPRQRGQDGWDVTVWSQTLDGFMPGQYGRLRITEKEDTSSLSDGIVTVTHQHLGFGSKAKQKKGVAPFRVFEALADAVEDAPLTKKIDGMDRRKIIEKTWKVVEVRIAATEV